jgi:hypothetical protein
VGFGQGHVAFDCRLGERRAGWQDQDDGEQQKVSGVHVVRSFVVVAPRGTTGRLAEPQDTQEPRQGKFSKRAADRLSDSRAARPSDRPPSDHSRRWADGIADGAQRLDERRGEARIDFLAQAGDENLHRARVVLVVALPDPLA